MSSIVRITQNFGEVNQSTGQTLPLTFAEAQRIARKEQSRNRPGVFIEIRTAA